MTPILLWILSLLLLSPSKAGFCEHFVCLYSFSGCRFLGYAVNWAQVSGEQKQNVVVPSMPSRAKPHWSQRWGHRAVITNAQNVRAFPFSFFIFFLPSFRRAMVMMHDCTCLEEIRGQEIIQRHTKSLVLNTRMMYGTQKDLVSVKEIFSFSLILNSLSLFFFLSYQKVGTPSTIFRKGKQGFSPLSIGTW